MVYCHMGAVKLVARHGHIFLNWTLGVLVWQKRWTKKMWPLVFVFCFELGDVNSLTTKLLILMWERPEPRKKKMFSMFDPNLVCCHCMWSRESVRGSQLTDWSSTLSLICERINCNRKQWSELNSKDKLSISISSPLWRVWSYGCMTQEPYFI